MIETLLGIEVDGIRLDASNTHAWQSTVAYVPQEIVLIAHRLRTIRQCDVIFELSNGRVVASGTYPDLLRTSERFRQMAGAVA